MFAEAVGLSGVGEADVLFVGWPMVTLPCSPTLTMVFSCSASLFVFPFFLLRYSTSRLSRLLPTSKTCPASAIGVCMPFSANRPCMSQSVP